MTRDGMDAGTPFPRIRLASSAWFAGTVCLLALVVAVGAVSSNLPLPVKVLLAITAWLLLAHAWQRERRAGLRGLGGTVLDPVGDAEGADVAARLWLEFADGRRCSAVYAGHALLGSIAIFIYVEREGGWRLFGPRRFTLLADAMDADSFRRLRAWVRLARMP